MNDEQRRIRWRLVLGKGAEDACGGLDGQWADIEQAVGFLYDREYGEGRNVRGDGRSGGMEESQMSVPDWINAVNELFPKETIERLEKDALERYKLEEMVTNPEVLKRAEPSETLLKAVLRTKHLMNQEVLGLARELVAKVVRQLMEKLSTKVRSSFTGTRNRNQRSFLRVAKNFDPKTTINQNLENFDPEKQRLFIKTPFFNSRVRRQVDKWQVIILVDESGSMMDSVIHAAVTASIFWGIKTIKTHLCIFDTSVVDLTADCADPVETLMKVQLGGGTDIGQALSYAEKLVENPRKTIVVLITDFYEGAPRDILFGVTRRLCESGVKLLGLAALDETAKPNYDRHTAAQMVELGAEVAAMTPGELAAWVAEKVR